MVAHFVQPKGALYPFQCVSEIQNSKTCSICFGGSAVCTCATTWFTTEPLQIPSAAAFKEAYLHLPEVAFGT